MKLIAIGFRIFLLVALSHPDNNRARKWYELAAEQGNEVAQQRLGMMYEHGQGVDADPATAVHWYQSAATEGFSEAQFNLANMYYQGTGVEQGFEGALNWYYQAAAQGHQDAYNNLCAMVANGEGLDNLEEDSRAALEEFVSQ